MPCMSISTSPNPGPYEHPVPHLVSQIQPLAFFLQTIHRPHALQAVFKPQRTYAVQRFLPRVPKGCMPQVMEIRKVIGSTPSSRLDHFIHDIVTASMGKNDIIMSEPMFEAMMKMREFMWNLRCATHKGSNMFSPTALSFLLSSCLLPSAHNESRPHGHG